MAKKKQTQYRFGIGEWFGKLFTELTVDERKTYLEFRKITIAKRPPPKCPFQSTAGKEVACSKRDGVCTSRIYKKDGLTGEVTSEGPVAAESRLRTLCPARFRDGELIKSWVGEVILGTTDVKELGEIPFLEKPRGAAGAPEPEVDLVVDGEAGTAGGGADGDGREVEGEAAEAEGVTVSAEDKKSVGRIDNIVFVPGSAPLRWCPLEKQAVYFQGPGMESDFVGIQAHEGPSLPFPTANRRPDYRSSGPKRLMPQLQVKVPTLRRWGKKMAVVVDESFFDALGDMRPVKHISNSDIVWFVIGFDEKDGAVTLARRRTVLTTLEDAVEGLTNGLPSSLEEFEAKIQGKIQEKETNRAKIAANVQSLEARIVALQAKREVTQKRLQKVATDLARATNPPASRELQTQLSRLTKQEESQEQEIQKLSSRRDKERIRLEPLPE